MITSPYNFVPLNKQVFLPDWSKDVSMDIPFEDAEDGWIEVEWRNDSPLFIRDTSVVNDRGNVKNNYSMHIMQPDGSRLYFLPGSSLKGMLRSVMSILAFGKMDQYNNRAFGHREYDTKLTEGKRYQAQMTKVCYGWLSQKGEDFILEKCNAGCERIEIQQLRGMYSPYAKLDSIPGNDSSKISAWARNKAIKEKAKEWFPVYTKNGVRYRIFATGKMHNKLHELLIPTETIERIKIDSDTKQRFLDIYAPTPDFEKFLDLMEQGESIPVSYVPGNHGEDGIVAMGMGRMIRYPYKYDVKTLVEKEQKCGENDKDLCETIFGWTNKQDALKGRVQIGNAFADRTVGDDELKDIHGVFGSPKASYYPLYIKQEGKSYQTYEDADAISGRKRYRIHKGSSTMRPPQGNGNTNTMTTLNAIPTGCTFKMRVNVHNLRKVEVGALLSAITLHRQAGVWHNIGSGKSYGLGKLVCQSMTLNGLKYTEAEYLGEFELCIDKFLRSKEETLFLDSPQLKRLMAIASEHAAEKELKLMELKEYTASKKNNNFFKLQENERKLKSAVSEEQRQRYEEKMEQLLEAQKAQKVAEEQKQKEKEFTEEHKSDYDKIAELEKSDDVNNLDIAKSMLSTLISQRSTVGLAVASEPERIQLLDERIQQIKAKASDIGLETLLDEKNPKGEYKVNTWKICESKVKAWMKKKKVDTLDDDAAAALCATIIRLKSAPDKKEAKEWAKRDGKIWKGISALLSEEVADELYSGKIQG